MEMPVGGRRRGAADADAANRREMPARTPPNARARLATHKQNFDDMLNFARNNPCVVAQVLLSLVALASPLHSVWLQRVAVAVLQQRWCRRLWQRGRRRAHAKGLAGEKCTLCASIALRSSTPHIRKLTLKVRQL